ncbi:hypothetical protein ACIPT4_11840 [Pectobacterium jejuense]|uniref:hypothetical protein n=1 Tax=Pectobacterium jejuense TaxID=2974022 RepID=UPI0038232C82
MSFAGRKILFIGIGFYDYEASIADRIEKRGGIVTSCTDRPALLRKRPWGGIFSRIAFLRRYFQKKHEENIVNLAKNGEYNQVFFIKAVDCSFGFIKSLREVLPKSEFILYEWDSLKRFPSVLERLPLFDRVLSFDRKDALDYPGVEFRPLFFRNVDNAKKEKFDFDLVFIGLMHSSRLSGVRKIQRKAENEGLLMYVYMTTNLITWIKLWLRGQSKDVHVKQLDYKNVMSINNRSSIVLDLPHPDQMGLTMRSIESIGLDKKIITTGKDIVNYDFYNQNNVCVINIDDPYISSDFLNSFYEDLDDETKSNYSLDKWLSDVLR